MGLLEVYTYGNGDYIAALFSSIALMVGGSDYYGLVKVAGMIGLLYVILQGFLSQRVDPQYIIVYAFVLLTMLTPKVNIGIVDRIHPENDVVIGNVPLGIGGFAYFTSKIGDGITRLAETNFGLPDDLKYQNGGLVGGVSLIYSSKKFIFPPSNTKTDLGEFLKNCTFYELASGQKNMQDLIRSQNILDYISTESTRFTTIHPDSGTGTVVETCASAYSTIVDRISDEYPVYLSTFERALYDQVTGTLEGKLVNAYSYLGGVSDTGFNIIIQNSMLNMLSESFETDAKLSGINPSLGALSVSQAEQQQRVSWFTTGALAKRVLPLLRSILEGLLYGLFPFVFILFLLPNGFKYIYAYITNLFWIQSWGFFFAVLNLGINIAAKKDLSAIIDGSNIGLAIISHMNLYQTSADFINMSGAMAMAVPLLSLGIITGGGYAVANSIGAMTSATSGASESSSGSISKGDLSYGNVSFDNMSAHKENMMWESHAGANALFQERTQSMIGNSVDQYGTSGKSAVSYHTGTGPINLNDSNAITKSYNHAVGQVESQLKTDQRILSNRFGSMFSDMASGGKTSQAGESRGTSETTTSQQSYADIVQKVQNTLRDNGTDEKKVRDTATQILGAASISAMFAGSGLKGQKSWSFKGGEAEAYNQALREMESMGGSKIRQDMESFSATANKGTTNSTGYSFSSTESRAFNQAEELLGSVQKSYSNLKNIQDQYSEMQKNDFGVSAQLTGEFNEYMKERNPDGWAADVNRGMLNDPIREQFIEDFMTDRVFDGNRIIQGVSDDSKERATSGGNIEQIQFEEGLRPEADIGKTEMEKGVKNKQDNISKSYESNKEAFNIKPKTHDSTIENQRTTLMEGQKEMQKNEAGFRNESQKEITEKDKEIKNYNNGILSKEIGKATEGFPIIKEGFGILKESVDAFFEE